MIDRKGKNGSRDSDMNRYNQSGQRKNQTKRTCERPYSLQGETETN